MSKSNLIFNQLIFLILTAPSGLVAATNTTSTTTTTTTTTAAITIGIIG
jgi:hypothetical protein